MLNTNILHELEYDRIKLGKDNGDNVEKDPQEEKVELILCREHDLIINYAKSMQL